MPRKRSGSPTVNMFALSGRVQGPQRHLSHDIPARTDRGICTPHDVNGCPSSKCDHPKFHCGCDSVRSSAANRSSRVLCATKASQVDPKTQYCTVSKKVLHCRQHVGCSVCVVQLTTPCAGDRLCASDGLPARETWRHSVRRRHHAEERKHQPKSFSNSDS